jgi:hypothetical protein
LYSPIVIVSTHADCGVSPLDEQIIPYLNDRYGNLISYVHVSLLTGDGVDILKDELSRIARKQPYTFQKIPERFLVLQQELRSMSNEKRVFSISQDEFIKVAAQKTVTVHIF